MDVRATSGFSSMKSKTENKQAKKNAGNGAAKSVPAKAPAVQANAKLKPKPPTARQLRQRLAQNLRRLRQERALTIAQAAVLADLRAQRWQKIEAGESNTTLRVLDRIAAALEVPGIELFRLPRR